MFRLDLTLGKHKNSIIIFILFVGCLEPGVPGLEI